MENLLLAAKIVMPLFLLMAVGFAIRGMHVVDRHTIDGINDLVFKLFLPAMLFRNLYNTSLDQAFNGKLVLFAYCSVGVITALAMLVVPKLEKDDRRRGVLVQAIFRSNFVIFGLPLTESILGQGHAGASAMLIAFVVPVFNAVAVGVLEYYRGSKFHFGTFLKSVVTNPLIIASAAGVLCIATGLRLPELAEGAVDSLAAVATPLSLVGLGAAIEFKKVRGNFRQLVIGTVGRLVVVPLLGIPVSVLAGFRGAPLVALVAMFATPTAISSFTMSKSMGGDDELAAQLVVSTCGLSVLSVFVAVYALICAGLI